jgi:hypothetical protein
MIGLQTFAERIKAEETSVAAGQPGCGYIDPGCHGGLTCVRVQHDDTAPHVGRTPTVADDPTSGQLTQWMPPCPPPTASTP